MCSLQSPLPPLSANVLQFRQDIHVPREKIFLSIYHTYILDHKYWSNTGGKVTVFYDGNEINNATAAKVGHVERFRGLTLQTF